MLVASVLGRVVLSFGFRPLASLGSISSSIVNCSSASSASLVPCKVFPTVARRVDSQNDVIPARALVEFQPVACSPPSKGAYVASFNTWHHVMENNLHDAALLGRTPVVAHILSADATNRAVWMGQKIQGAELESFYIFEPKALSDSGSCSLLHCDSKRGFADAQIVEDSSAAGTHAILAKQVSGLGSFTWLDCPELDFTELELVGHAAGPRSVRLFCYTSDGGPDEVKLKKLLQVLTKDNVCVLVFGGSCGMHSCQLYVRSGLKLVDDWCRKHVPDFKIKYFALLSKISQVWRDKASDMYKEFDRQFGPVAAIQYGKTMCPRCVAGRWQSSHAVERRLQSIGQRWFTPVMNEVLKSKKREEAAVRENLPLEDELDPLAETTAEHRNRMRRRRSDVSKAINDRLFWILNTIHTEVNTVAQCFMDFLGKKYSEQELLEGGGQAFRLTMGRSNEFLGLYAGLLESPKIFKLLQEPTIKPDSEHEVHRGLLQPLIELAVCLVCHHAANFLRRIHEPAGEFPFKIAAFASKTCDEPCAARQGSGPTKKVCFVAPRASRALGQPWAVGLSWAKL